MTQNKTNPNLKKYSCCNIIWCDKEILIIIIKIVCVIVKVYSTSEFCFAILRNYGAPYFDRSLGGVPTKKHQAKLDLASLRRKDKQFPWI